MRLRVRGGCLGRFLTARSGVRPLPTTLLYSPYTRSLIRKRKPSCEAVNNFNFRVKRDQGQR